MKTEKIIYEFGNELFFFILKKVKDKEVSNDIFQNTFLKIHEKSHQLKDESKVKAWVFQIARNEINDYYQSKQKDFGDIKGEIANNGEDFIEVCCLNKMINQLPDIYKEVIDLAYVEGKKQKEIAELLSLSLSNVKIRLSRGKEILKQNLRACCQYEITENGKLKGESRCSSCD